MAADDEAVDPRNVDYSGKSLAELREILADRENELSKLRAEREQEQRDAVERIEAAKVVQNIAALDAEIALEQSTLNQQKGQDTTLIATGEGERPAQPEILTPPPAPETPENSGDNEQTEGDEN